MGIVFLVAFVAIVGGGTLWYMIVPGMKRGFAEAQKVEADKLASLSSVEGFTPTVVYKGFLTSYGVAIDPATSKFAIAIPGASARVYHYTQLIAAEVDRDGTTITTTKGKISTGSAAVATAIAGPVGGLLMGAKTSSTSTTDETVMLALKLYVDDIFTPCFTIPFGGGFKDEFGADRMLKEAVEKVDAWFGRFRSILVGLEGNRPTGANPYAITYDNPAPAPIQLSWTARTFAP